MTKVATNLAKILALQNKRGVLKEELSENQDMVYDNPVIGGTVTKEKLDTLKERIDDPRKCRMSAKDKFLAGKPLNHKQKLILLRDGIMDSFLGTSDDPEECKAKLISYVEVLKIKHPSVAVKLLDKVMPKDDGITNRITVQAPMIVIDATNPDNVAAAMNLQQQLEAPNEEDNIDFNDLGEFEDTTDNCVPTESSPEDKAAIDAVFSPVTVQNGISDLAL